jgi:hypothetical protein
MRAWPSNETRAPGSNRSAGLVIQLNVMAHCLHLSRIHTPFVRPEVYRSDQSDKLLRRLISGSDSCNRRANASVIAPLADSSPFSNEALDTRADVGRLARPASGCSGLSRAKAAPPKRYPLIATCKEALRGTAGRVSEPARVKDPNSAALATNDRLLLQVP